MHAGINDAALRLVALGRVHALSCMVGGKAWTEASIASLRRLDGDTVDIGLHLDFTETPLRSGSRRGLPALIAASLLHRLDARMLQAEIASQLDAFEKALGRPPAFIDGHQHVHQLPVIRTVLMTELLGRYPTKLPWLRSTRCGGVGLKARLLERLGGRGLAALARRCGAGQNGRLLGVYDFKGGAQRYRTLLARWIASADAGDLLMCHPSTGQQSGDPIGDARLCEYDVLSAAGPGLQLEAAGVHLAPMSRILAGAQPLPPDAPFPA